MAPLIGRRFAAILVVLFIAVLLFGWAPLSVSDQDDSYGAVVEDESPSFVIPDRNSEGRASVAVVTAATSRQFCRVTELLRTVRKTAETALVIVYDLGLSKAERQWLQSMEGVALRRFDFRKYPAHFDVGVNMGHYAWKAVIVDEVLDDAETVFWMDPDSRLEGLLKPLVRFVQSTGFYSPVSESDFGRRTDSATLRRFKVPSAYLGRRNCNTAFLGFSRARTKDNLVKRWRLCAMEEECVKPKGSVHDPLRLDIGVVTALAYTSGNYMCKDDAPPKIMSLHLDLQGRECENKAGCFAVGVPTSLSLVTAYAGHALQEASLDPQKSGSFSAVIAVYMSTLLPTAPTAGPRVAVAGTNRGAFTVLRQMMDAYNPNVELTAIAQFSFGNLGAALQSPVQQIENSRSTTEDGVTRSLFTTPRNTTLHVFEGGKDGKAGESALSLTLLAAAAQDQGPFSLLVVCHPVLRAALQARQWTEEYTALFKISSLVDWSQPTVFIWDIPLSPDGDTFISDLQQVFTEVQRDLPPEITMARVVRFAVRHAAVIMSNLELPVDLGSFDASTQSIAPFS